MAARLLHQDRGTGGHDGQGAHYPSSLDAVVRLALAELEVGLAGAHAAAVPGVIVVASRALARLAAGRLARLGGASRGGRSAAPLVVVGARAPLVVVLVVRSRAAAALARLATSYLVIILAVKILIRS